MNIRFYNGRILSFVDGTKITNEEVWVQSNKIVHIGNNKETDIVWDREYNLNGNLLMPGFKNAHTHSGMTAFRSHADDLPLSEWLYNKIFPLEAKLTAQDVYDLSKLAIMEYLTSGITANFDMYMFKDAIANASLDCGFRTVLSEGINNFGGDAQTVENDFLRFNKKDSLISSVLGFHAEYTCTKELLQQVIAVAHKYKAPMYCHNSESKQEVAECLERTGMTPTAFLDSLGMYEYGGGGFHCVHFTDQDMQIFKDKGLWVVSNPASNAKLASGIAPLNQYNGFGMNIALGTDGPASNNCLDMFREMFLATSLQKLYCDDASAMSAEKVLEMATVGGAKAMGLTDCDTLQVGKKADMIIIDLQQPNMQPENNIVKNIVYSGSKQNVILTMVDGKILYEKGKFFIGTSPQSIYEKANEIIKRLKVD